MSVKWNGAGDLARALPTGVRLAGEALLSNTLPLVPLDSGDLRASGESTADGLTAEVTFNTEYAVYQEKSKKYEHETGQAGFFEAAASTFGSEFEQILGEQIRRAGG